MGVLKMHSEGSSFAASQLELGVSLAQLGLGSVDYIADTITLDQRAAELFDLPADMPVLRGDLHAKVHVEDKRYIESQVRCLLDADGVNDLNVQHRVVHQNGEILWLNAKKRVIFERDDSGSKLRPISGLVAIMDITALKKSEERFVYLMGESRHRTKNLIGVIQSIARMTSRKSNHETFLERFTQRLNALASNQALLISMDFAGVRLRSLVIDQLSPFGNPTTNRINIDGPELVLKTDAVQPIGLAIHELATNALKYGALSEDSGEVSILWSIEDDDEPMLALRWIESGGPIVKQPTHKGFGQTVIKEMAESSLSGTVDLEYLPQGLSWTLRTAISHVI
tara:strand:+ start:177156 stop:178175 length:1020 start_codon:yes stop_codon:yes gene_type:complete